MKDVDAYLSYLDKQLTHAFETAFSPLLHGNFRNGYCFAERIAWALVRVASLLRLNLSSTIIDIVGELVDQDVLEPTCTSENATTARYFVFCMEGWLTLLYLPSPPDESEEQLFRIDTQDSGTFRLDVQPLSQCSRPFMEVLDVFGVFSDLSKPSMDPEKFADKAGVSRQTLLPSFLAAPLVTSIGGFDICWVDTICTHLTFDASKKKLFVFRLPSFARIQTCEGSLLEMYVFKTGHLTVVATLTSGIIGSLAESKTTRKVVLGLLSSKSPMRSSGVTSCCSAETVKPCRCIAQKRGKKQEMAR